MSWVFLQWLRPAISQIFNGLHRLQLKGGNCKGQAPYEGQGRKILIIPLGLGNKSTILKNNCMNFQKVK